MLPSIEVPGKTDRTWISVPQACRVSHPDVASRRSMTLCKAPAQIQREVRPDVIEPRQVRRSRCRFFWPCLLLEAQQCLIEFATLRTEQLSWAMKQQSMESGYPEPVERASDRFPHPSRHVCREFRNRRQFRDDAPVSDANLAKALLTLAVRAGGVESVQTCSAPMSQDCRRLAVTDLANPVRNPIRQAELSGAKRDSVTND